MKRIAVAAFLLLIAVPALAQRVPAPTPATVDMTTVLLSDEGAPIKDAYERKTAEAQADPDCDKCPPLTLGHAAAHALFTSFRDEDTLSPEQRWARGALAERIKNEKAAELSSEEVSVIKRLIGKLYGPLIIMRAFPLLDPNAKPERVK